MNFGLSGMAAAARTAAVDIRYEEGEEDTDITFRAERDHMGEGLDLIGVENMVSPILKTKSITHENGLCGVIVAGLIFCTLPLCECEMITHIKNRGKRTFPVDAWVLVVPPTGRIT